MTKWLVYNFGGHIMEKCPQGFTVTKWLTYNFGGQITEKHLQGFKWKHMHLSPPDFVGKLILK
jgi:hypothetical protein